MLRATPTDSTAGCSRCDAAAATWRSQFSVASLISGPSIASASTANSSYDSGSVERDPVADSLSQLMVLPTGDGNPTQPGQHDLSNSLANAGPVRRSVVLTDIVVAAERDRNDRREGERVSHRVCDVPLLREPQQRHQSGAPIAHKLVPHGLYRRLGVAMVNNASTGTSAHRSPPVDARCVKALRRVRHAAARSLARRCAWQASRTARIVHRGAPVVSNGAQPDVMKRRHKAKSRSRSVANSSPAESAKTP
jgi:hypothetical protein